MERLSETNAVPVQEISVERDYNDHAFSFLTPSASNLRLPHVARSLIDPAPSLVDLYQDLLLITEKLTARVSEEVQKEAAAKAVRKTHMESDAEDSDDADEEESGEVDAETSDEDDRISNRSKNLRPQTDLEYLLRVLKLHKKQKQHLLVKRAILLKFEEKLFGNNNITMTIDLRQLDEESKDGNLERILKCNDLSRYVHKEVTENGNTLHYAEKAVLREAVSNAKMPPDILSKLTKKAPKVIPVNLILQQYNIRWNTMSGEPKPFDFYSLPKHFIKGSVRKAFTQTILYEHKSAISNLHVMKKLEEGEHLQKKHFCPPIAYLKKDPYAKPGDDESTLPTRMRDEPKYSWQGWTIHNPEAESSTSSNLGFEFPPALSWISPKVKTVIKKMCEPIADDFNPESTANIMYMLVLNETLSPKLLESGGTKSQVYIGGADEGLKERFMGEEDSFCGKLMEIQKHFSEIEYFVPHPTALLIEMRLLLAMARNENYALFVLKIADSPRELGKEIHDLIIKALWLANDEMWGPSVNMNFGLNLKEELKAKRKFLPDSFPGRDRSGSNKNRKKKK